MSGSAAKVTRRDIRKAFGPEALEALSAQAEEIRKLQLTVEGLGAVVGGLKKDIGDREAEIRRWAEKEMEFRYGVFRDFRDAGWRARFRWLFAGRA